MTDIMVVIAAITTVMLRDNLCLTQIVHDTVFQLGTHNE